MGAIICGIGAVGIVVSVVALIYTIRLFAKQKKYELERIENE